jgi:hypothetical protein
MIKITKRTKTIVSGTAVIALLGLSLYFNIDHDNELEKYGRYTVGTTIKFTLSFKSGRQVQYEFKVNGKKYKSSSDYLYDATVPNGRYLVKFSTRDPEINDIYLDRPVSRSIDPPTDGWTKKQLTKR